ncbi:MAG: Dihydrolipoyllysine-residue succinyltransferase component of 2-oxoglutarate dehydrogenase complex [Chlamydiales bacterium]|nr:Dihydrolipoyllysine-residue succinyltransferase component of 2-oxoglutarate dehydrogenase complex [Chlamydiales bacterium]
MKEEIIIPSMGESISEADIGTIIKPTGSYVEESEEIIELETEKVNQALYAPRTGVINWTVQEGETVLIGDVIGFVDSEAEAPTPVIEKIEEKPIEEKPKVVEIKPTEPGLGRRIMQQEFVQEIKAPPLQQPTSQQPISQPTVDSERETRRQMSKMRQTIASRLVDSLHTAAMLTTFNEVDMSAIIALRAKYKESFAEKHGVKLGFMSFFVKAVVEALREFPDFNSYLEGSEIVKREYYDIGIAVGTEKGLLVPVVRACDTLNFPEIEQEIVNYANKARASKIEIADLQGGGFTITNGGVYGSLLSTPILNPPQVGILGMHKIQKRAVVVDDQIVIRPMMYLALSYDHRVVDGKEAVSFLVHVKNVLEDPARLMFIDTDGKI